MYTSDGQWNKESLAGKRRTSYCSVVKNSSLYYKIFHNYVINIPRSSLLGAYNFLAHRKIPISHAPSFNCKTNNIKLDSRITVNSLTWL